MIFIYIFFILIFLIIILFTFRRFSPIPYFPSNKKDLPKIIDSLNVRNNQIIFDLGAGDGVVIFESAKKAYGKKLNTKFVAVEINPVLLLILHLRRLLHPNKKNIAIVYGDMFSMDFSPFLPSYLLLTTCYLYISPWFLEKTVQNITRQIKNPEIVSYMYPVKSLKQKEKIVKGLNFIYKYQ